MPIKGIKGVFKHRHFSDTGFLFLSALIILFTGCAGKKGMVKPGYFEVLDKWTRSQRIYSGLESRLYAGATYKSPAFRDAYVGIYSKSYKLTDAYRNALQEREKEQSDKYNEFFLSVYTPETKWNDLERSDSVWRLFLVDDSGNRLRPITITKIDNADPVIRQYFPYLDLWSYGYIVRFPKYSENGTMIPNDNTKSLKLVITGILGEGELEWRLKK